jgi:hypothetical protein
MGIILPSNALLAFSAPGFGRTLLSEEQINQNRQDNGIPPAGFQRQNFQTNETLPDGSQVIRTFDSSSGTLISAEVTEGGVVRSEDYYALDGTHWNETTSLDPINLLPTSYALADYSSVGQPLSGRTYDANGNLTSGFGTNPDGNTWPEVVNGTIRRSPSTARHSAVPNSRRARA